MDNLKMEINKAQTMKTVIPTVLRRKASTDPSAVSIERANRSFASLRNIALEHFEDDTDAQQVFETQLDTIMTELHSRSERMQALEAEVVNSRQEMESKSAIISGLTRERSTSVATSAVDSTVVGHIHDQLLENEQQIRRLQESHAYRENRLQAEITSLRTQLGYHRSGSGDVSPIEEEHEGAEAAFAGAAAGGLTAAAAATVSISQERIKHQEIVEALQKQVQDYKTMNEVYVSKLEQLEQSHTKILQQAEASSKTGSLTEESPESHRELVGGLENQIKEHKASVEQHQKELETLHTAHSVKLSELQSELDAAQKRSDDRHIASQKQHSAIVASLEEQIQKHQTSLMVLVGSAAAALGHGTDPKSLADHIKSLVKSRSEMEGKHVQSLNDRKAVEDEASAALAHNKTLQDQVGELKMQLDKVTEKEQKSSRLVQELEDQLSANFDSHVAANAASHRLSSMHGERQLQLEEAHHARGELEKEVEDCRLKISLLESQLSEHRRRSNTSAMRESSGYHESLSPEAAAIALARSNSHSHNRPSSPVRGPTALPSPPPAIPLPPLPPSPGLHSPMITNGIDAAVHSSRPGSPMVQQEGGTPQVVEEQEARIRTMEKHLFAEKQLTATLEEALVDLETAQNKTRSDLEAWRKRCAALEDEIVGLRRDNGNSRASLQAVEEEREMRMRAERARMALEDRMRELNLSKKKKKNALNCF